ncbi:hypothetical protein BaRGS_00019519 [Batillaria attramentaria]|uniref:Uncharacterized protein n=1 Tax=Batillaria attramentaria TaxID=370345 RepID=A0ABD0KQW6_9CAEN
MATVGPNSGTNQDLSDDRLRRLPPFHAVLEAGGPPCPTALQFYLTDLDNKLEENSRQLDSCLQALLRYTNDLPLPGERTFSTPKDGLLHMYNSHVLEKDSCYDPEIDESVIILDALLQRLEQEPGCEEDVLQEVLTLASAEGLLLPLRSSGFDTSDTALSSASLHAIMDSSDQIIEQRWKRLAGHLKKYLSDQLSQLPVAPPSGSSSNFSLDRRLQLVDSFRVLCSDEDTWQKYKALRTQQLEDVFSKLMPEVDEEHVSHKDFASNCSIVADSVITMIDEDFVVLNSGVFRKVMGVFRALHDLYLEKFSDEMSLLVDEIADEVAKSSQRTFTQSKSEHGLHKNNVVPSTGKSKEQIHRNSVGAVTNVKDGGPVPRPQAQSLDSMFTAGAALVTDTMGIDMTKRRVMFPEECLQSVLSIVLALMHLEDHIDSLLRSVAWDVTGLAPKKTRRKASIRGVLKPSASPEAKRYSAHSLQYQHSGSFSSSRYPLTSLYNMAGVLKPSASPEAKRYSAHSLQYQHSGSFSSSDTQLDLVANSPHGDTAPKVVEHCRSEERVRWEWKLVFKKLSGDLSQAVEGTLLEQMQTSLGAESVFWEQQHRLETVTLDPLLQGGKLDNPKVISLASHQFLEVVDRLLPLARVGCDGCLMPVRSAFVDTLCISLKNFHVQLVKMSKDVPVRAGLKQLYIMLSTSVMIRNNVLHYESLLTTEDSGKKLFSPLLRQFSELIDTLMKQIVQLHSQAIATSVLFDAESTDWDNNKDFYEDERCSFPVQMWNFHLRGTRYDLWATCPPHLAQTIFSSILQDSLLGLMQRYARVQPSFRRIKQYRYDLTAILLCVLDHLLWACNSVSKLLDPGHGQLPHYSIHNLASNLLAALAVGGCPLDLLYRVFRQGFSPYKEALLAQEGTTYGNTQWMHWMWPSLFHMGQKHYDDIQTTCALYLQLTLLMRQPQPNWGLLVQALLMKEFTLSIILLTRSLMMASAHHSHSESLESNGSRNGSASDPTNSAQTVVFAMVSILAQAHQFPNALAKCVLSAVERCDEWELFNVKTTSAELKPPLWMEAVFDLLDPLVEKIMEPMLFFLLKERSADTPHNSVLSRVQELPCGCATNTKQAASGHAVPAKDLVQRCLELLIAETQQNMYSLSRPIAILFHTLQTACTERNIKTPHSCIGIQVLAWAVWTRMRDTTAMERLIGLPVSQEVYQQLSMLADFFYQIMVFGKAKGTSTPRLASKFHKTHKEWLPKKMDAIVNYLSHEFHHVEGKNTLTVPCELLAGRTKRQLLSAECRNRLSDRWYHCKHPGSR